MLCAEMLIGGSAAEGAVRELAAALRDPDAAGLEGGAGVAARLAEALADAPPPGYGALLGALFRLSLLLPVSAESPARRSPRRRHRLTAPSCSAATPACRCIRGARCARPGRRGWRRCPRLRAGTCWPPPSRRSTSGSTIGDTFTHAHSEHADRVF